MKILLVEDDALIGESIRSLLTEHRYVVEWVDSCAAALTWLKSTFFGLVILDLGLPDGDGRDVIRWMRKEQHLNPVLVLSSRSEIRDRVAALDFGADDYLTKPFDIDELLARVRAATRRPSGLVTAMIEISDLRVDLAACRVYRGALQVYLRPREYQILLALIERRGRVVSRQMLEELISTHEQGVESNTIEVFIHGLRKKLGASVIETVRGRGYVIPKE